MTIRSIFHSIKARTTGRTADLETVLEQYKDRPIRVGFRDIPKRGLLGSLRLKSQKKRRPTPFAIQVEDSEPSLAQQYRDHLRAREDYMQALINEANHEVATAYVNGQRKESAPPKYASSVEIVPDDSVSQIAISVHTVESVATAESTLSADIVADAVAGLEWLAMAESAQRMNLMFRNKSDDELPTTDSGYSTENTPKETEYIPISSVCSDSVKQRSLSCSSTPLLQYRQIDSTMSVVDLTNMSATTFIRYPSFGNISEVASSCASLSSLGLHDLFASNHELDVRAVRSCSVGSIGTQSSIVPLGCSYSAHAETETAKTLASTSPASNVSFTNPAMVEQSEAGVAVSSENVLAKIPDQTLWAIPPTKSSRRHQVTIKHVEEDDE